MAATFMHSAIEWLYPASIEAFGVFRDRTHSIQLRMLAAVSGSPCVLASVSTASAFSTKAKLGSRFASIFISAAERAVRPPVGVTVCFDMSIIPPFE